EQELDAPPHGEVVIDDDHLEFLGLHTTSIRILRGSDVPLPRRAVSFAPADYTPPCLPVKILPPRPNGRRRGSRKVAAPTAIGGGMGVTDHRIPHFRDE